MAEKNGKIFIYRIAKITLLSAFFFFIILIVYQIIPIKKTPVNSNLTKKGFSDSEKYELYNKGKIKSPKAPQLYVEGPYLKRQDTKKIVQLKGVTTMAFVYYEYQTPELIKKLDTVKKWKINLLGLYLNYDNLKNKYDQLDIVINWAEKNGIYIYLMPAINKYNNNPLLSAQINYFPQMMKNLALKYVNKTHILYGLWAEPRLVFWEEWVDKSTSIATGIREVNPNSVILVSGVDFGRYFYIDQKPFPFDNIIYDYHDYPFPDSKDAQKNNGINPDGILWEKMIGKYPIMVGEFGGVYQDNFGSNSDINYISFILDKINKNQLSYTAYTIDDEGELGLVEWKTGKLTKKGKVIHDDLSRFPPTFID